MVEGHTKHKGEVIFVELVKVVGEFSCNNCLDRNLKEAYKLYVGSSAIVTVVTICTDCMIRLSADMNREVMKVAMGGIGSEYKD